MSQNVLQCYAKENIWAAPRQDTQFIIEPIKLTKRNGAISYTDVVKDLSCSTSLTSKGLRPLNLKDADRVFLAAPP